MSTATRPDWATVPNLVTLVRFVMLAPVCVLLVDGPDTLAVVLLLVWASTDWVDGLLARALGQASRTGAIIVLATLVLAVIAYWILYGILLLIAANADYSTVGLFSLIYLIAEIIRALVVFAALIVGALMSRRWAKANA